MNGQKTSESMTNGKNLKIRHDFSKNKINSQYPTKQKDG